MAYNDEKGGRPPVYDELTHPELAAELIMSSGVSNAKLARIFKVSKSTIHRWMHQHQEFWNRVIEAQDVWNAQELTLALVKRAKGYEYTETTHELVGEKLYVTKKVKKYVSPDTGALRFALTNMACERFYERKEVKVDTPSSSLELVINTGGKELVEKD